MEVRHFIGKPVKTIKANPKLGVATEILKFPGSNVTNILIRDCKRRAVTYFFDDYEVALCCCAERNPKRKRENVFTRS
jgi:hypothetical protein